MATTTIPEHASRQVGPPLARERIHVQALQGLHHYFEYGDWGMLGRLLCGVPGFRSRALLMEWCYRYAGLKWNASGNVFWVARPRQSLEAAGADPAPYYTLRRRNAVSVSLATVERDATVCRCSVCGAVAMPGEDTCYSHHSG